VHFALTGLDMTPHMVNRNSGPQQAPLQPGWKQSSRPDLTPPDFLYDLYAVCNHHGGMHGGHYTGLDHFSLSFCYLGTNRASCFMTKHATLSFTTLTQIIWHFPSLYISHISGPLSIVFIILAFCRNSVDGQWYSYDDSSAEPVPEAEVCTRGAYILFYQRRNTIPPWSASSSVTG